ncbi:MAG: hypothetical protein NXI04_09385 [Planctomycetaceae bacterium]|nr:hypothetical protein [Planctomycetaceae bacterium]
MIPRIAKIGKVGWFTVSAAVPLKRAPVFPSRALCLTVLLLFTAITGCATSGNTGASAVAPAAAAGPADVYIAAAPAVGPPPTLPQFLGIDQCKQHTVEGFGALRRLVHRMFPALETAFPGAQGPPPVSPVSSPENLESPSPAVAAAAKIKQEEDQAQQKILALNYLASIGCGGCYPEVEDALLAAMDDCTEDVRYAAVKAVKEAAGQPCTFCKNGACCSPRIRARLREMSDDQGDDCCPREPSARIRRVARIALTYCGPDITVPVPEIEGPPPPEDWATSAAKSKADREFTAPESGGPTTSAQPASVRSNHQPAAIVTSDVPPAARPARGQPAPPVAATSTRQTAPTGHSIGGGDLENNVTDPHGGRKAARQATGPIGSGTVQTGDPLEVNELVTEWYATIDPTLPLTRKKAMLRSFLAERFRQEAEQKALVAAASAEYEFRDQLQLAVREQEPLQAVPVATPPRSADSRIQMVSAEVRQPIPARSNAGKPSGELHVSWEQMELQTTDVERERDLAMMNEIWRLVNRRVPDPMVNVDKSRLRIRTSGLVPISEVPSAKLREVLKTADIGTCSPVFVTRDRLFLIRVLDRSVRQAARPLDER